MREDSPFIANVHVKYPVPQKISAILDRLHKLERGPLTSMLNTLAIGKQENSAEFDWGQCVGYANALFFTGKIDADQQRDLCIHAKELRSSRQE